MLERSPKPAWESQDAVTFSRVELNLIERMAWALRILLGFAIVHRSRAEVELPPGRTRPDYSRFDFEAPKWWPGFLRRRPRDVCGVSPVLAIAFGAASLFSARADAQEVVRPTKAQVSIELRTIPVGPYTMDVPSLTAATDVTAGADGVLCAPTINGNATPICNAASISAMPWPAKLDIKVHDDASGDTLVCTSVRIRCIDQFGEPIDRTVYPQAETVLETPFCCEKVTYVAGAGCTSNSGDAGDVLRVSASAEVCLPVDITNANDVVQAWVWDLSATELFTFNPSQLTIDLKNNSVEFDNLTPTLAAGDVVWLRVRAP